MGESDLQKVRAQLGIARLILIGLAVVLAANLVLCLLPEHTPKIPDATESGQPTEIQVDPTPLPSTESQERTETTQPIEENEQEDKMVPIGQEAADSPEQGINIFLAVALVLDGLLIVLVSYWIFRIDKVLSQSNQAMPAAQVPESTQLKQILVGKVHNIGRRSSQQDSFGIAPAPGGLLAVVADGMGGLSGGDQVSQMVVKTMLQQAERIQASPGEDILRRMTYGVNEAVNRMLGPDGLYKSGSTLLAVLIQGNRFRWLSVGDSRIYLYRSGALIQLNHEHTYGQELLQKAMQGDMQFDTALADPQRHKLTSFIGMGRLKYVDGSICSLMLVPGDRILMMSDGVFNALPEAVMAELLHDYPDVTEAGKQIEAQVLAVQDPNQDNFTAVIIGL